MSRTDTLRAARCVAVTTALATGCSDASLHSTIGPAAEPVSASAEVGTMATWTVSVLPVPAGCVSWYHVANAISDDGRIVGACNGLAVEWVGGIANPMPRLPGFLNGTATAVATGGVVAGYGYNGTSRQNEGWLRGADGRMTVIADRGIPVPEAIPSAVTPAGVVVGCTRSGGACTRAFKWGPTSGFQRLPHGAAVASSAVDINSAGGIIVGYIVEGGLNVAVKWTLVGGLVRLPALGTGGSRAWAINGAGRIVGEAYGTDWRPVAWTSGPPSLIPWPGAGSAKGVSERNRVVGEVTTLVGGRTVTWFAATEKDGLAQMLPRPFWALTSRARGVDRCGSVVGTLANDDARDGTYAPTIERAALWRRVGCDF